MNINVPSNAKQIPNFSRYYAVREGSIFQAGGRVLKPYTSKGYRFLKLLNDENRRVTTGVHRLIVSTFSTPIPTNMWVGHKDSNKLNNHIDNLEIVSPTQTHTGPPRAHYLKGEQLPHSVLTERVAAAIRILYTQQYSQYELSRMFFVSQPTIHSIVNNKTWR